MTVGTSKDGIVNSHKNKVHRILAHSYSLHFFLFLIAVILDSFFRFEIFSDSVFLPTGVAVLIFGSILILWAQRTSHHFKKEQMSKESFHRGPYRYTRGPTHLGLFLLLAGFSIIANAFFVFLFSLVALVLGKFVFLHKQEAVLAEKYGSHYLEYKKLVRF